MGPFDPHDHGVGGGARRRWERRATGRSGRRAPRPGSDHGLFGTVDAHEGLAERLGVPPGTWISGVAAETRYEIDQTLARIGRATPMVIGEFRIVRLSD
jgi:hypothetical protein